MCLLSQFNCQIHSFHFVFQIKPLLPVSLYCTYNLHILLNKYHYHIANVRHTVNMLNEHMEPTLLYICVKTQPTSIFTSRGIAKCVLETDLSTKLGIYAIHAKYLMGLYGKCIHTFVPHMKLLQLTIIQGALYTYLTYITKNDFYIIHICSTALLL